jgi:hypothetical protein
MARKAGQRISAAEGSLILESYIKKQQEHQMQQLQEAEEAAAAAASSTTHEGGSSAFSAVGGRTSSTISLSPLTGCSSSFRAVFCTGGGMLMGTM